MTALKRELKIRTHSWHVLTAAPVTSERGRWLTTQRGQSPQPGGLPNEKSLTPPVSPAGPVPVVQRFGN